MPPAPSARRLSMLGCMAATAAALALTLSACGSGETAAPESAAATQPGEQFKANAGSARCPREVDAFRAGLVALRGRLALGLSYEQYAASMRDLGTSYDEIPVDRLTIGCLTAVATPGEKALNRYIDAANAWGECLADAACTTASIEPVLQKQWRSASRALSVAQ